MYPARAVQTLWLLKGGNSVRVSTYSVFKKYQTLTVPVNSVTCLQTRADASAQIPMKISGKWFFYLLDKRGKFHNPELFDFVIGLNRSLKWSRNMDLSASPAFGVVTESTWSAHKDMKEFTIPVLFSELHHGSVLNHTFLCTTSWICDEPHFSLNYIMGLWWSTLWQYRYFMYDVSDVWCRQ